MLFGEFDGDGFEFGDELAQAAVGGEVGAEPLGVLGGEGLGDGAGAGFAGPGGVGPWRTGGVAWQWQPGRWQRVVRWSRAYSHAGVVVGGGLEWVRSSLAARPAVAGQRDELVVALDFKQDVCR